MTRRVAALAVGCMLACAALAAPGAAAAATFSDSFVGRETVKGLPVEVTGSNAGADREPGEPPLKPLAPAGHTVWVEWEAESSGYVTLSTCDSSISTVLGVYVGSQLDQLTEVDSVASFMPPGCSGIYDGITFFALSGGKFEIAMDGNAFLPPPAPTPVTEGPLSLRIEATPPPANDDFAAATPITGRTTEEPGGARFYFADSRGYNWGAGKEAGEPNHAGDPGGASVWYSWTAPESRSARVSICCSAAQLIAVYVGGALGSLSEVKSGEGLVEFPALAGTTYEIAVDGEFSFFLGGPLQDDFDLVIQMTPPASVQPPQIPASTEPVSPPRRGDKPPRTRILKSRVRQKARSATFSFDSNEEGSSFRCRLDGRRVSSCASPRSYANLAAGAHVFRVYAVDAAGNADATPVVAHFSIRPQRRHG